MTVSVFDLFSIGVGPSSSHTVGPMRAAKLFADGLTASGILADVVSVKIDLFGSLAATGAGHGTFTALQAGLEGREPQRLGPHEMEESAARIAETGTLILAGAKSISYSMDDVTLRPLTVLPRHSNGVRFEAWDSDGTVVASETYYSIGGGFVVREGDPEPDRDHLDDKPFSFRTADELLAHCRELGTSIAGVALRNELSTRTEDVVRRDVLRIHEVMQSSVSSSVTRTGVLPGGLAVRRRAKEWHDSLLAEDPDRDPAMAMDWVHLVAMAVNEENASGGRVVTAPTNGAAGIIPAVLHYGLAYLPGIAGASDEIRDDAVVSFFLTAAAIGSIFKERASISGAEVGCQGEVGSASSMAAAGLAELLGGSPEQVENAAEIAMEHNLGLTCDPIGGLVQIPCIERNAIAASQAINAARMALRGDGTHHVSLDQVIETMRQTGLDMSDKYKETALGGLAVNVPLC